MLKIGNDAFVKFTRGDAGDYQATVRNDKVAVIGLGGTQDYINRDKLVDDIRGWFFKTEPFVAVAIAVSKRHSQLIDYDSWLHTELANLRNIHDSGRRARLESRVTSWAHAAADRAMALLAYWLLVAKDGLVPDPHRAFAGITLMQTSKLESENWIGVLNQLDAQANSMCFAHVTSSCDNCGILSTMPYDKDGALVDGLGLLCAHGVYDWRICSECEDEHEASVACDYKCEYTMIGATHDR